MLSCVTAIGVAFFMGITGVKMPMVWAVLAFIFNFIPNVGSMLATIMPLPIILVDSELTMAWKVLGFALPAVWNAYIGNVLEPTLFGKSLNLTAISVFIGLVLWASLWGIPGAILSVPLLGAQKILLDAADYPLAKRMLHLMREDNSVEELIEARGFEGTEAFVKAHMEALDTVSKPHSVVHQHDHDLEQPHGNHASPCVRTPSLVCCQCLAEKVLPDLFSGWSIGTIGRSRQTAATTAWVPIPCRATHPPRAWDRPAGSPRTPSRRAATAEAGFRLRSRFGSGGRRRRRPRGR